MNTLSPMQVPLPCLIGVLVCAMGIARADTPPPELDSQGRMMLDALREEALHPRELIARIGLRAGDVVADVGAGPGFLTLPLARALPKGRVLATDVQPTYLAVLTRRATAAGVRNVQTRVVRPDEPGLEPKAFDVILLCQVDHYLKDRAAYLSALVPALRPGGRIVLVNYTRYRDADRVAAQAAGLQIVDEWTPSPPFFMMAVRP
jgi:2-polyprenyl-3-methyl-5-hydroxy-6-metoxy-1,4-benzoquinol methylase